mmetsp:Transcript_2642/g.5377  ORF Transcript_2642/g.5377 Transcript_2642/m.5377 type:complete len:425 (+) Transcript_2642:355-1629(+)
MALASRVACIISLDAPEVTLSCPNTISSATRPPIATSSLASICLRDMDVWSPSGSCITMPRARPRGIMVALCTGSAPSVLMATSACPASWKAVIFIVSGEIIALLRSAPIIILSLAYSSAAMPTLLRLSTDALRAAWFTRLKSSAPENPGVPLASCSMFTSLSIGTLVPYSSRMALRPPMSGMGTSTCLSNRPGLTRAASRESGKFVAAITITPWFSSKPSISTSSWLSVIFIADWSFKLRLPPIASISSMKMMLGDCALAAENNCRTRFAPTPTYISSNSEPDAWKKGTFASPAIARAKSVFPVPGGPVSSTPFGSFPPNRVNRVESRRYITISSRSPFASSMPTTSANVLSLFSALCTTLPIPANLLNAPAPGTALPAPSLPLAPSLSSNCIEIIVATTTKSAKLKKPLTNFAFQSIPLLET